jgi:hypothetical protein
MAHQVKIASKWKAFVPTAQWQAESMSTCVRAANGKPGRLDYNHAESPQLAAKPDLA